MIARLGSILIPFAIARRWLKSSAFESPGTRACPLRESEEVGEIDESGEMLSSKLPLKDDSGAKRETPRLPLAVKR